MRKEYTCHFWIFWMPFIVDRITHFGTSFLRLLLGQLHHLISVESGKVLGKISIFSSLEGFEPKLYFITGPTLLWLDLQMQNTLSFFLIRKLCLFNEFFDLFPSQLIRL